MRTDLLIDRGYTGHEHLDYFNLVNMNGRVYDPLVGRFLSPDPLMQSPAYTQNFNRYSYCINNPFRYTDPSGYLVDPHMFDGVHKSGGDYPGLWVCDLDADLQGNPFPEINGGYRYNWTTGQYEDAAGNIVSYNQVYWNYVIPNTTEHYIGEDARFYYRSVIGSQSEAERIMVQHEDYLNSFFQFDPATGQFYIPYTNQPINPFSVFYGSAANGGSMTGIPQSNAFKYGVTGTSIWGYTVEAGFDAARITQRTVSTWSKGARLMGRTNTVLTATTIGYDFATGTANTSTLVNAGVNVAGAIVVGIVGVTVAPWVAGGLVVYGIFSIAGGDEWLNSHFDISNSINFVNPAANIIYRGPNGGYVVEGTW